MASMGKLYPPVIANTIPAFYEENGTVKITVPFSMNRAVSKGLIEGFSLKIKTAQSNTFIKSLVSSEVETAIANKMISFYYTPENENKNIFKLGLFYKFQVAYISKDEAHTVGYFSTVAIGKYTSSPTIYIKDAEVSNEISATAIFKQTYLGVYELGADQSERPYSYNFYLYDDQGIVEESGWLLHNTTEDDAFNEKLQLTTTADEYTYKTTLLEDKEYYIQYAVRTINNLEVYSKLYPCIEPSPQNAILKVNLNAENIFEEGYMNLSITVDIDWLTNAKQLLIEMNDNLLEVDQISVDTINNLTDYDSISLVFEILLSNLQLNNIEVSGFINRFYTLNHLITPVTVEICRAEKTDNYQSWILLRRIYFSSYEKAIKWSMKDFTIEQGITYKYCIREYNRFGIYNERILSQPVVADFEDMFLYDGKQQLKIRFNPKMSSFKATKLEQKLDTIGNKYPFIFKNGVVDYKEFPISGLISYQVDNNELFLNHLDNLNILLGKYPKRSETPINLENNDIDTDNDGLLDTQSWEISETLDSVGYNMRAERRFKLKVLEWLNNSEVKLFRSPTEGSYLVRLMNISMSPEDRLGRMLHTFNCQAYEVDELNYNNLLSYGFITLTEEEISEKQQESRFFCDSLPIDGLLGFYQSIKINKYDIYDYLNISLSPNTNVNTICLRIGSDSMNSRTLITGQKGLTLQQENAHLPDIYYNPSDNEIFLNNCYPNLDKTSARNVFLASQTLFSGGVQQNIPTGLILTYGYITVDIASGDIQYINNNNNNNNDIEFLRDIYIQTLTQTVNSYNLNNLQTLLKIGDSDIYDDNLHVIGKIHRTFNKVFGITFYKKQELEITENNGVYYLNGEAIIPDTEHIYHINNKLYYRIPNNNTVIMEEIEDQNDINNLYRIIQYQINSGTDEEQDIFNNEGWLINDSGIYSINSDNLTTNTLIRTGYGLNFVVSYQIKVVKTETEGS